MANDFIMSARNIVQGSASQPATFGNDPAPKISYLLVPDDQPIAPRFIVPGTDPDSEKAWKNAVIQQAVYSPKPVDPHESQGDVIFICHGFNNDDSDVINRHRAIKNGLATLGYKGAVVSFDWPSADSVLNYLSDRNNAKATAAMLVNQGFALFADQVAMGCVANLHVLGHSTGAYVMWEAFNDADWRAGNFSNGWMVSQAVFIAGDVAVGQMEPQNEFAKSLYDRVGRLTNYYNGADAVLAVSSGKRLGLEPRVGRKGLPADAPDKTVDIDCSAHYSQNKDNYKDGFGVVCHSWYFQDMTWMQDFLFTIEGKLDRNLIPTRKMVADSDLQLL